MLMKSSIKDQKADYLSESEHYEQLSELLKKSYETTSDTSLYVQIDEISQWAQSEHTKPLLIASKQFGGTKTLLCEFMKHMEKSRLKCIIISEFASVTPYYSEILYKITMQLRTHLNINQKVELNEEKLRQYFSYWLEVADQRIQKDYLSYLKDEKMLLIVLIEGIDKVVDNKHQSVRPTFWLPDASLKNIKIIYTAQTNSAAIDCLLPSVSHKIEYVIPDSKIASIKENLYKQNPKLKNFNEATHFGDLKIASKILNSHPKLEVPEKDITFEQFFIKFVHYTATFLGSAQNIYKMLGCLIWSKKGISKNTLRRSFRFQTETVQQFLTAYRDIIVASNQTYLILNRKTKQYITKIISSQMKLEEPINKKIHVGISRALKKQVNTLSILEQLIYQLTCSQNYTELKELLSRVENFLVLYTPLTKHLLCMCWFQLEIQFQYDPVFEYNKAIERFLNHYYPSPEDTFKIIFQLSLFFKEYAEFENSKTPQFRHPPIRGEVQQLRQISIYDQIIDMNMYQKCKMKSKQSLKENLHKSITIQKEKEKVKEKEKDKEKEKERQREREQEKPRQSQAGKNSQNYDKNNSKVEPSEGKEVEKLNVRIRFHQEKFKSCYLEQMEPYLNQFFVLKKKTTTAKNNQLLDEDSDDSENEIDETKIEMQKIKKYLLLKRFSDYCQEEYHRHSQRRSFYYYKQWIWMQFPWICQSLNSNFSQLIAKCMRSPTEYMSINLQSKLISDAIKIAKIAKQNKRQIYEPTKPSEERTDIVLKSSVVNLCNQKKLTRRSHEKSRTIIQKSRAKFDISKLEEQLQKNVKKNKTNRHESSIFMTDLSMSQSYVQEKQNSLQPTSRLPHISRCSNLIQSKAEKNIQIMETREYAMLVSKCDELRFENEQLMQKIQCIQFNKESLTANGKQSKKQFIKAEIEEIKQKKFKLVKSYRTQEQLRAKLEMIVKLCDINKSHGSESADLNNFLSSLKLMFKIEEENLENINQKGKKILQESKASYKKIKEEKSILVTKLKKQKSRFQKSFTPSVPLLIEEKGAGKSKHQTKRKKNESYRQETRKNGRLDKELEQINSQLRTLEEQFEVFRDQNSETHYVIAKFQQKMDKLNEIEWKLNELVDQNTSKQQKLSELEEKLNVSKGHRQHQKQVRHREMQSRVNENLLRSDERIKCLQKCFSLIEQAKLS